MEGLAVWAGQATGKARGDPLIGARPTEHVAYQVGEDGADTAWGISTMVVDLGDHAACAATEELAAEMEHIFEASQDQREQALGADRIRAVQASVQDAGLEGGDEPVMRLAAWRVQADALAVADSAAVSLRNIPEHRVEEQGEHQS